jgi:hypothetical protein
LEKGEQNSGKCITSLISLCRFLHSLVALDIFINGATSFVKPLLAMIQRVFTRVAEEEEEEEEESIRKQRVGGRERVDITTLIIAIPKTRN